MQRRKCVHGGVCFGSAHHKVHHTWVSSSATYSPLQKFMQATARSKRRHVPFGSRLENEDLPRDDISIVRLVEILLTAFYKGSSRCETKIEVFARIHHVEILERRGVVQEGCMRRVGRGLLPIRTYSGAGTRGTVNLSSFAFRRGDWWLGARAHAARAILAALCCSGGILTAGCGIAGEAVKWRVSMQCTDKCSRRAGRQQAQDALNKGADLGYFGTCPGDMGAGWLGWAGYATAGCQNDCADCRRPLFAPSQR